MGDRGDAYWHAGFVNIFSVVDNSRTSGLAFAGIELLSLGLVFTG
jgi:hypothetical protein